MHLINKKIPVKLGFLGSPKPFDKQGFDSKLDETLASLFDEYKSVSQCDVIKEAKKAMLELIEHHLYSVKEQHILVSFEFDDKFTEWWIMLDMFSTNYSAPNVFQMASQGFASARTIEEETLLKCFGFKRQMSEHHKYKVTFLECEAIMDEEQLKRFKEEFKRVLPGRVPPRIEELEQGYERS